MPKISPRKALSGLTVAITATVLWPLFAETKTGDFIVVVCNFTPQPHSHYRVGVPERGYYRELFNSDARDFGGSNMGNLGGKWTDDWSFHSRPYSLDLTLPPLGVLALKLDRDYTAAVESGQPIT
jgi:1,4-alpha-glucan branching enzyme